MGVETVFEKLFAEFDEILIPMSDNCLVLLKPPETAITIEGRTVYYREGYWLDKDENDGFYADWALTWFYLDRNCPKKYLYYEQDSPNMAIRSLTQYLKRNREV